MSELLCSKSHEFVYEKDGFYYIGLTDIILNKLGTIKYIDLPQVGERYSKGEIFGFADFENFALELFMPLTSTIEAVNTDIINNPNALQSLSFDLNWLIKVNADYFNEDKKDLICYNKYKEQNS